MSKNVFQIETDHLFVFRWHHMLSVVNRLSNIPSRHVLRLKNKRSDKVFLQKAMLVSLNRLKDDSHLMFTSIIC